MPSGKKLRSIGRQMCPQDHLISVRGQKILRWNLGRTFLYTILLYDLFFFFFLVLFLFFILFLNWQRWVTIYVSVYAGTN